MLNSQKATFGPIPRDGDSPGWRQTYTSIDEGQKSRNTPGYWQQGSYSTIINNKGLMKLEIMQIMHVPRLADEFFYMQYMMIKDVNRSNKTYDHYESQAFTVRNTESAREGVTSTDYYHLGFNGTDLLSDALPGTIENFNRGEQTIEFPWFVERD